MPPCCLIVSNVDLQLGFDRGSKHLSESQPAGPASAISPMSYRFKAAKKSLLTRLCTTSDCILS
jgi:hypothetical protein